MSFPQKFPLLLPNQEAGREQRFPGLGARQLLGCHAEVPGIWGKVQVRPLAEAAAGHAHEAGPPDGPVAFPARGLPAVGRHASAGVSAFSRKIS